MGFVFDGLNRGEKRVGRGKGKKWVLNIERWRYAQHSPFIPNPPYSITHSLKTRLTPQLSDYVWIDLL